MSFSRSYSQLPDIQAVYATVTGRSFEVVGRRVRAEMVVPCPSPAHPDKHPSCTINACKALFYCHACGAGGGVLDLVVFAGLANSRHDAATFLRERGMLVND